MQRVTTANVFSLSQACLDEFGGYRSDSDLESPLPALSEPSNIELGMHLKKRFEIWADWSGALAREGYRFDDRLKAHEDLLHTFIELLEMIHISLVECRQFCSENQASGNRLTSASEFTDLRTAQGRSRRES